MSVGGSLLLVAVAATCAPERAVRLAEVFYDAAGDDRGHEFVELANVSATAVPLAGARLEVGDGSGPGRWTVRWTATPADTIAAFGRFVVGGDLVPTANAHATLDLQNGPDAVRLAWPEGASETLGYGALESSEYFCGDPASDVPSGFSLARIPDDAATGSNALDFRAAAPSPGRANQARRNLAWVRGSSSATPEQPEPGQAFGVAGLVHAAGAEAIGPGEARARWRAVESDSLAGATLAGIEPGDTARVEGIVAGLAAGRWTLVAAVEAAGDESGADDADTLIVRVGPGAVEITEIQFHPASGEGEWIEVRNRDTADLRLDHFTLSDRGTARGVPERAAIVAPGGYAVLAQDAPAFRSVYPGADSSRVVAVRPWPSLNNSDDATGVADVVVVREADGTACARHPYSARGVPAGVPLERAEDGLWQLGLDARGTPLAPPRARPDVPGGFVLARPRLVGADRTQRCAWSLPWARARLGVDVYDLAGRHVARVARDREAAGRGELEWDAADLDAGLYLVVMRARRDGGDERLSVTRPLRVEAP